MAVLIALVAGWGSAALAQDVPALTPPIAQGSSAVPYPPEGEGDGSVLLELLIDEAGNVTNCEPIEGAEPFAEHARRAALSWKFSPARMGERPVAARIRARVEFRRDPSANLTPTGTQSMSAPPTTASAPVEEQPLEVTVQGVRRDVGQTTLSADDIRVLPGAFGDPFRAIEALPSVTPIVSGLPYFYFRGAPPNNNAFYVDGVRVPLLFHVGLGAGVIHAGLIDHIDVLPGAPPASYGGFAGAVIAGYSRAPAQRVHGEANLRLVDVGALAETPFAGTRGSVLVAGHYGYPGPILGAITPELALGYWDYQARASWRIDEHGTLGLFVFGSHDYIASGSPLVEQFVSDFHRLDLRYDRALGDGNMQIALTAGYDYRGASPSYMTNRSAAARLRLDHRFAPALRIRAGADARFDAYGFEHHTPATEHEPDVPSALNPPPVNFTAGAHADVVWRIGPHLELVPGVRLDVFTSTRAASPETTRKTTTTLPAVDPRFALRVILTPAVSSLSSAGLSHQFPGLRVGNVPGAVVAGEGFPSGAQRLQTAAQVSQGFEFSLPADIVITTTGFYSGFWGMTDLTGTCYQLMPPTYPANTVGELPPEAPYYCPGNEPVHGRAYGFELMLRRAVTQRLSGWLSYALSRSTRQAHFPTLGARDAVATVPSEFDRTHVLNAALSYDLGAGWRAGGRFVFFSGAPYSALAGSLPVPPYHDRRTPAFFRLDLRLEKRWTLGRDSFIALVIEGQNVTLSKERNPLGRDCDGEFGPQGGTTTCQVSKVGPITIPSLGVEAVF
jgi:hypothetical protein